MKRLTALTLVTILVLSTWTVAGAAADTATSSSVTRALSYLRGQQQADGSYTEFDGPINATTGAALAVAAAGLDLNGWTASGASMIDFLRSQAAALSNPVAVDTNAAKIAMLVMALKASGYNPRDFGGVDWVALLQGTQNGATGAYGTSFIRHPWIMLALRAGGAAVPSNAVDYLTANQEADGGFGVNGLGSGSDTNSTAICLQALIAAGQTPTSPPVQAAVAYLHTQQNSDGGFPWAKPSPWGTDSDSSSTSWVIQGLIAAGENQTGPAWTQNGQTPISYLLSMQNADGSFGYQKTWPDDNLMCTYQAIPALTGKAFPLDYVAPAPSGSGTVDPPADPPALPYTGR